jgi:hypothetical protein
VRPTPQAARSPTAAQAPSCGRARSMSENSCACSRPPRTRRGSSRTTRSIRISPSSPATATTVSWPSSAASATCAKRSSACST